ncbi:hypothetical protein [Mechercharimyces sp. CAU 1602]|uniref:hypothetical protein n=1 Tax=Mechercharimyces sp. CAU 1602 TaxID=2973933 RepID=UPI002162FC3E|nr:hypothetical protein [Mechercharimyces sp. CAU 1602]MCS1350340.1 hypothetical protein [Mechercharimyces sp. CAU 1602]
MNMEPMFVVVGVAIGSSFVEKTLEKMGHGSLIPFVSLISWAVAGWYTLDFYMGEVSRIGSLFR